MIPLTAIFPQLEQRNGHSCHLLIIYFMPSPLPFLSHFVFVITYEIYITLPALLTHEVILSRLGNSQTKQGEYSYYITGGPLRDDSIIIIKSVMSSYFVPGRCSALSYLLLTTAQRDSALAVPSDGTSRPSNLCMTRCHSSLDLRCPL